MKKDPTGYNNDAQAQMKRLGVNFSTARELIELADSHKPALQFSARTPGQWRVWRRKFLAQVNRALGPGLPRVAPAPRVVEKADGGDHWRYKLVYRTTARMWAPGYLLVPKSVARSGARAPAVLTIHGHGYGGVDLVGLSPEERTGGNPHHNYALSVARRGMVAFAPELRGFGQRAVDEDQLGRIIRERGDPEAAFFRRDLCNVQNLKANLLGYTFMRLQLHDLSVALDVLQARPEVNPARIGACGLSTGGMMTLFLTATDRRIRTATISGTLTSYRSYAFRIETTCGSQLPHGILHWGDLADVGCLIAPRPVCFETGAADFGFLPDVAKREFRRIKRCYEVAGAPERAVLDAFSGGHEWHGAVGLPMMEAWLKRS
ncbi:MAG: alpha/beta hydrolase family protein [Kiritimatiellia bacterium]|jgi:dienelactone hydrolase